MANKIEFFLQLMFLFSEDLKPCHDWEGLHIQSNMSQCKSKQINADYSLKQEKSVSYSNPLFLHSDLKHFFNLTKKLTIGLQFNFFDKLQPFAIVVKYRITSNFNLKTLHQDVLTTAIILDFGGMTMEHHFDMQSWCARIFLNLSFIRHAN